MTKIEATYRIVTPMFCSGADQTRAELRVPSFKGVLRFWWRALAWRRGIRDPQQLWEEEARLFGSTGTGVGCCLMRLKLVQNLAVVAKDRQLAITGGSVGRGVPVIGQGARYFGYGVMEAFASKNKGTEAGQLARPCFEPGARITFELCLPGTGVRKGDYDSLLAAMKLVGLVGGLGSKSRKGFGSLTLTRLVVNGQEEALQSDPALALRDLLGSLPDAVPPWTAWSDQSRIVVVEHRNGGIPPLELLDRIGREMVRYRSWGKDGKILQGMDSEKNFRADHDLMKKPQGRRESHPKRIAFGLPHNYGKGAAREVEPAATGLSRRASPLFIHIHQVEAEANPVGVISFVPATFLPPGRDSIRVGSEAVPLDEEGLWQPVTGFMDRLADSCREPIAGKEVSLG